MTDPKIDVSSLLERSEHVETGLRPIGPDGSPRGEAR